MFLPLHGHTPGQRPVGPADALASLLRAAGVPAAQIPPGLQARAALWRDSVAGKRILLVLDNAAGHEQVRPLLPGTAGSLVLVTSRRRLAAWTMRGDQPGYPAPGEAAGLLARLAGPARAARRGTRRWTRSPGCAGTCRWRSGCSPRSCATTLPGPPAELAAELAAARDRLAVMRAENLSVATAFDLSYADLTPGSQRLFRRLGLVPGPDFDAYAAAALDGTSLDDARRLLEELDDQHLIAEPRPAVTGCTTCSASTPAPWPPPTTRRIATPRPGGCWTTTCTPRWPLASACPPGTSIPASCHRPGRQRARRRWPRRSRQPPGWKPNAPTCTRPPPMPPPLRGSSTRC